MPDIQLITRTLFEEVRKQAEQSPRRRMNHNFHASMEDNPHPFLNVLLKGTYCRPHRHLDPPKAESWVLLSGAALLLIFDDAGTVTGRYRLEAGGEVCGIDVAPGVWHTVCALTEWAVIYEVKPGPWAPATDKAFAEWAPEEGDPRAPEFLERWLGQLPA
ncbi:MAG: WbuC family cupin fold metalloprotein [Acidobacteria bacterium]|nr:WbuC family cupin fold metalloprotein [Acidobacteriota bacterium]